MSESHESQSAAGVNTLEAVTRSTSLFMDGLIYAGSSVWCHLLPQKAST